MTEKKNNTSAAKTQKSPRKKTVAAKKTAVTKKTTLKQAIPEISESVAVTKEQPRYRGIFNIFAFFLSSFYFAYKNMAGYFILFLFLPILFYIIFGLFLDEDLAIFIGWLSAHIIAGFCANPLCRRNEKKYQEKNGKIDTSKPAEYFAVPLWLLVLFTLLSGGVYMLYWGYRNWKSYQKATNDDVSPASNAFFFNLTVIPLFSKMSITLKSQKLFLLCGIMCLCLFVADNAINYSLSKWWIPDNRQMVCLVVLIFSAFLYPFCVVPVQKKVNEYTTTALKKTLEKRFYPWEIVILLIGMIFNYVYWFGNPFIAQPQLTVEQGQKIGAVAGFIYSHTKVYPMVCAKAGYEMKNYPTEFKTYFAEDIAATEKLLTQFGYAPDNIDNILNEQAKQNYAQNAYEDLTQLKKNLTVVLIAREQNIPIEQVQWQDDMNAVLTLDDVCAFLDENAKAMISENWDKDFLKKNLPF